MRPISIDIFAGAGGFSLGFEQAGFDVIAAIDNDPVHCAVHEFNFPHTTAIAVHAEDLTGNEIRRRAGLEDAVIDCVIGGAPCQGFSLIGQRALDDPRNGLVLHFVRLVHELDAKSFVFENVKGLTVGNHQVFLKELVESFQQVGYACRLPWKVLNAGHFGTPQSRERLILMGVKKGLGLPEYPEPTTNLAGRQELYPELAYGPSCADAISDLPNVEAIDALIASDAVATCGLGKPSDYAAEMRCLNHDHWHFGYRREWDPRVLTSSARTEHGEISRRRFRATEEGTIEPISRYFRLPRAGVSNTLRAGTDRARGAFTSPRPIHYSYPRCITVREMARLHGFPDWFRFHATKWHGARQIGNAVPPPLARSIATKVIEALDLEPSRPRDTVRLGNPGLLKFDISHASSHFGVNPPPNTRRRKRGAKKLHQQTINDDPER